MIVRHVSLWNSRTLTYLLAKKPKGRLLTSTVRPAECQGHMRWVMIAPNRLRWVTNEQGNPLAVAGAPVGQRSSYIACWMALSVYVCCLAAFIADMTSINTV